MKAEATLTFKRNTGKQFTCLYFPLRLPKPSSLPSPLFSPYIFPKFSLIPPLPIFPHTSPTPSPPITLPFHFRALPLCFPFSFFFPFPSHFSSRAALFLMNNRCKNTVLIPLYEHRPCTAPVPVPTVPIKGGINQCFRLGAIFGQFWSRSLFLSSSCDNWYQ